MSTIEGNDANGLTEVSTDRSDQLTRFLTAKCIKFDYFQY